MKSLFLVLLALMIYLNLNISLWILMNFDSNVWNDCELRAFFLLFLGQF